MPHKFAIGTVVYYDSGFLTDAARGVYKITKQLPVEAVTGPTPGAVMNRRT